MNVTNIINQVKLGKSGFFRANGSKVAGVSVVLKKIHHTAWLKVKNSDNKGIVFDDLMQWSIDQRKTAANNANIEISADLSLKTVCGYIIIGENVAIIGTFTCYDNENVAKAQAKYSPVNKVWTV